MDTSDVVKEKHFVEGQKSKNEGTFWRRSNWIPPAYHYNHRTKTFKKNKRKGL